MLSLEERQIDRVKRKAENMADSTQSPNQSLGAAMTAVGAATDAINALSLEDRKTLEKAFKDGLAAGGDQVTSDLERAGIGIVNPLIVPASEIPPAVSLKPVEDVQAGKLGGWATGNADGRAVDDQAGASLNDGEASAPAPVDDTAAKANAKA